MGAYPAVGRLRIVAGWSYHWPQYKFYVRNYTKWPPLLVWVEPPDVVFGVGWAIVVGPLMIWVQRGTRRRVLP